MHVKLSNTQIRKHFQETASTMRLIYVHLSSSKWPWKRLSHMAYLASVSFVVIVLLKICLQAVPLRSKSHDDNSNNLLLAKSKLLNIKNFEWLMNNDSICIKERDDLHLLVLLVHTARNNLQERNAIRNTWGSLKSYKSWSIRVVFLLGSSPDLEPQQVLERESNEYGDMVMGNFIDTYRNLTYKHVMGYKWIVDYCPNATFVWKVDDDIFIDTLTLIEWRMDEINRVHLNADKSSHSQAPKLLDFYCAVLANSEPQRDPNEKWFVSKEVWALNKYPTYCSGWAYGISVSWIKSIYSVSQSVNKILWIDDVFVTGSLVDLVHKSTNKTPYVRDIWHYATFLYDPIKTTFCIDNGDERKVLRFGVLGRLLRGEALVRESKCIWDNILNQKWKTTS